MPKVEYVILGRRKQKVSHGTLGYCRALTRINLTGKWRDLSNSIDRAASRRRLAAGRTATKYATIQQWYSNLPFIDCKILPHTRPSPNFPLSNIATHFQSRQFHVSFPTTSISFINNAPITEGFNRTRRRTVHWIPAPWCIITYRTRDQVPPFPKTMLQFLYFCKPSLG